MSKPLSVWSILFYLTEVEGLEWRQADYDANKMIRAVKGEPIKGYFEIDTGDKRRRFDQNNVAADFLPVLWRAIARKLSATVSGPFDIVPIPNSTATVEDFSDCRIFQHGRAIADAVGNGTKCVTALRWKNAKTPAHEGGSRDPQVHFENLRVVEKPTRQFILFDDVLTTGSQTIAAYRRLVKAGVTPMLGMVVGRAVKDQRTPAIGWYQGPVETESAPVKWPT